MNRDRKRVTSFIAEFVAPQDRQNDILEDLDTAFAAWLRSGKRNKFTSQEVIRIVGSALGSYCADRPPTRSHPFTSVQYRIEDNKTDFVVAIYRSLEHQMKRPAR